MCKDQSTRQRMATGLPGKHLCRVLNPWHTAKVPFFAVCCGLWHTANLPCLPCVMALDTRQSSCAAISCRHGLFFAECRFMRTEKALSCVQQKNPLQRRSLPTLGCSGAFAVCYTWQSLCRVQIGLCRVFLAHGK